MPVDWNELLRTNPGVLQEFEEENSRDRKSKKNLADLGILDAEDYAQWWDTNLNNGQYAASYVPSSNTPTVPPGTGETYTPPTTDPVGTGAGGSTTPGGTRDTALNMALANARWQLMGQGLNPDEFMGDISNYLNDIYKIIPEDDKNAGSYFDPNFVGTYIGGKNAVASTNARNMARGAFGSPGMDYTSLDATISKLLEGSIKEGEEYLDRGFKRGQFNEAGVKSGRGKLDLAKSKATAKLRGYANDIFNTRKSEFDDIRNRALADASDTTISDPFDIAPYRDEYERLSGALSGPGIEGELLSKLGNEDLIDLNELRGGIAKGQGTVNLKDLDVLEGLERRKNVASAGRGLGSEGAF